MFQGISTSDLYETLKSLNLGVYCPSCLETIDLNRGGYNHVCSIETGYPDDHLKTRLARRNQQACQTGSQ